MCAVPHVATSDEEEIMRQRLVILVVILALFTPLGTMPLASNAANQATPSAEEAVETAPANTHASVRFGYLVTWDDSWTVLERSTAPDEDRLVLTNGTSSVAFIGHLDRGGLVSCLDNLVADFEGNPTMIRLSPAVDKDGNVIRGGDNSLAYAVLTYTYTPQNGSTDYAVLLECRAIGTRGVVLQIVQAAPLADYNDQIAARDELLAGVRSIAPTIEDASLEIDLEDIQYDPAEVTISANTDVTITLTNTGASSHTFDIDALNVHSGELAPGASTTVTINAPAGNYEYYCAIPGHKQAGMVGTLHVVEGGGAPSGQGQATPAEGGQPAAPTVDLVDIAFQPTEITIPANTDVTITITNNGAATHTFDIDALNIHTGEMQPGTTKTVTVNAAPGDFEYYCAVPGHKQAGMVGTLHVVEGGGAPGGQGQATPVEGGEAGGQPAPTVEMHDISFQPPEITIPANTDVTINLVNKGATTHNFNIDQLNVHSGDYAPGQTGTVTINAAPGTYEYYCAIPGHKQAGMVGTLIVQ
jgi:uncharacterized cupredoxin-like copper-binding protein